MSADVIRIPRRHRSELSGGQILCIAIVANLTVWAVFARMLWLAFGHLL